MHLKHSPDDSDSEYIGSVDLTPLVLVLFPKFPFFGILALHNERKKCGLGDPAHVTPRGKSCMYQMLGL